MGREKARIFKRKQDKKTPLFDIKVTEAAIEKIQKSNRRER